MREPISLKGIIAIVIQGGRTILCVTLAIAICLGGYQFCAGVKRCNDPANSPEQIEQAYQEQLAAYEKDIMKVKDTLSDYEKKLEHYRQYCEESIFMSIDPYHVVKQTSSFAVLELEEDLPQAQGTADRDRDYRVDTITHLLQLYWNTSDLEKALEKYGYSGVDNRYVKEIVAFSALDNGMFSLVVYGATEEEVAKLSKAACGFLTEVHEAVADKTYSHQIVSLHSVVETGEESIFVEHQETVSDTIKAYEDEIEHWEAQLKLVSVPQKAGIFTMKQAVSAGVKWFAIGAVLGFILACVWILGRFLFINSLESSRQMEALLGVPYLGSLAKRGSIWSRMAGKLMNERAWATTEEADLYLFEHMKSFVNDGETVAVISSLSEKKVGMALSRAQEVLSNTKISAIANAENSAGALKALRESKYAVLAERIGVSDADRMQALVKMAQRMDVQVVGFITI